MSAGRRDDDVENPLGQRLAARPSAAPSRQCRDRPTRSSRPRRSVRRDRPASRWIETGNIENAATQASTKSTRDQSDSSTTLSMSCARALATAPIQQFVEHRARLVAAPAIAAGGTATTLTTSTVDAIRLCRVEPLDLVRRADQHQALPRDAAQLRGHAATLPRMISSRAHHRGAAGEIEQHEPAAREASPSTWSGTLQPPARKTTRSRSSSAGRSGAAGPGMVEAEFAAEDERQRCAGRQPARRWRRSCDSGRRCRRHRV